MASVKVSFLLIFASLASAILWEGPYPTNTATDQFELADYSPAPTKVPNDLIPRDVPGTSQFCGWEWGINQPYVPCNPFSTCLWREDIRAVGCCRDTTNLNTCAMYTTCIDFASLGTSTSTASDSLRLACTNSANPWCASLRFEPSPYYYNYVCTNSPTFWDIKTTYVNQTSFVTDIPRFVTPASASTTITTAPFSVPEASGSHSPTTTLTPIATHSNKAAIIGGSVAGGVGVLSVIGAIIFCVRRRSISQHSTKPDELPLSLGNGYMHVPANRNGRH